MTKLNSIRLLTQRNVPFTIHEFPETIHSAAEVADYVNKPANMVYKTLVVFRNKPYGKPMLIMAPGDSHIDFKKVAGAIKKKKTRMATHEEAEAITGLKTGGISALALLNKGFDVYLDQSARMLDTILVSAGRRGVNVELPVKTLLKITRAQWIEAV